MAALMRISQIRHFRPIFKPLSGNYKRATSVNITNKVGAIRCIHRPAASSSVPAVREQMIEYPPVVPRWPPGVWGELNEERAWELYEQGAEIEDIRSLWDKLNKLTEGEHYFFQIKPFIKDSAPRLLPYQKYLTKTHLCEGELPSLYDSVDVEDSLEMLRPVITRCLIQERSKVLSKYAEMRTDPTQDVPQEALDKELGECLIKRVQKIMIDHLNGECDHLLKSMVDKHPNHESFWAVAGMREECDQLSDDGFLKLQYSHTPLSAVRVEQPLPVFAPLEDELCSHPDIVAENHHIPKAYEIEGSEHQARVDAGFLTKTPFNEPCPNEFGLLTSTCITELNQLIDIYSESEIKDLAIGCGLMTAFGSTLTQAHCQGFNWWSDITYPITTQSIVFDGKNVTFSSYQLNTLALWKIGENGIKYNNVCWTLPQVPLFDEITEDTVVGLNDDALRTFLKFLKLAPVDRDVELRPYLDERPSDVTRYINRIDEPLIERPHPPRIYSKSKKVKLVSPVVVTQKKIEKMYQRADEHWDEMKGRFVPGPRLRKPSNRIRQDP